MPTPAATDFPESFSVAAGFSLAAATPGLETIPIHANATTPSIMRCIVPSLRFRRKTPIPLRSSDRVSPAFHAGGEGAVVGAARRLLLCLLRGHRPTTPVDTADDGPRGRTPPASPAIAPTAAPSAAPLAAPPTAPRARWPGCAGGGGAPGSTPLCALAQLSHP